MAVKIGKQSIKSPQNDFKPTVAPDFDGDSITKTGRIGANPETYEGKDLRVEPHSITVQQEQLKQEKLEEEEADEPPCPIGFVQNESIATEFCSDIDEVEYDMDLMANIIKSVLITQQDAIKNVRCVTILLVALNASAKRNINMVMDMHALKI